jgi:hypothetical protein
MIAKVPCHAHSAEKENPRDAKEEEKDTQAERHKENTRSNDCSYK